MAYVGESSAIDPSALEHGPPEKRTSSPRCDKKPISLALCPFGQPVNVPESNCDIGSRVSTLNEKTASAPTLKTRPPTAS